jgi:membrane-associated phospholipid phosphatase
VDAADTADTAVGIPSLRVVKPGAGERPSEPRSVPVLEPPPNGLAARVAHWLGAVHPVRAFVVTVLAGYALLVGVTIAAGFVLTSYVVANDGVEKWDNGVNRWLAERRDPTLTDLSWIGSTLAGGLVIPVVVGVLLVGFLLRRKWLLAAFTLFVIAVESGSYRATTLVVERDRPPVHRLEGLDPTASFPSGHIAATVALYGGVLLVLSSRIGRRWFSALALVVTLALVLFVGWARMYRGMHHVTDTAAGVLVGVLALAVTLFAARVATAAATTRDAEKRAAS